MQELRDILKIARDAWSDVLEGKVEFANKPVRPNLAEWGVERSRFGVCEVCVAGAYYLRKYGELLNRDDVQSIEWFLDIVRRGDVDKLREAPPRRSPAGLQYRQLADAVIPFYPPKVYHFNDPNKKALWVLDEILKKLS